MFFPESRRAIEESVPTGIDYALVTVILSLERDTPLKLNLFAAPNLDCQPERLNTNQMQVITNQSVDARMSDLLAAIAALPKQEVSDDDELSTGKN